MKPLAEGRKAPNFVLNDRRDRPIELAKVKSDYVVLYFYPRDNTPGCTIEANEFTRELAKFRRLGAEVIGISGGDAASKEKFCKNHKLKITLLSDPEGEVGKKYGAYGKRSFLGKSYLGFSRTTFVLGPDRKIVKVYPKVSAKGHAEEVLEFLRE